MNSDNRSDLPLISLEKSSASSSSIPFASKNKIENCFSPDNFLVILSCNFGLSQNSETLTFIHKFISVNLNEI
jgi:hypothetical protein